jgi:hypothetical protein
MRKIVALNERGYRIGESHPRATIPQGTVDLVFEYAEDRHMTVTAISHELGLAKSYVSSVLHGKLRGQLPESWVTRYTKELV